MGCGSSRAAGQVVTAAPVEGKEAQVVDEPKPVVEDKSVPAVEQPEEKQPEKAKASPPHTLSEGAHSVLSAQGTPQQAPIAAPDRAPAMEPSASTDANPADVAKELPAVPAPIPGRVLPAAQPARARPAVHDRKAFTFDGGEMTVPRTNSWAKAKPFGRKDRNHPRKNLSASMDGVEGTVDAVHPSLLFGDGGVWKKGDGVTPLHKHCVRKEESLLKATARKRHDMAMSMSMDGENPTLF
eukprot:CAMPEP_0206239748 /NCGR_PEP_ID=MMETSP0047_2-20121206/15559_1 /ASSEMBLY_ACC=CAM_ASM_000192 /TAXON_ID=195065 /ORGANISM="Chroomonas mesostigmatica_cf, Strain CCMP1168" /LENGTH=239 /DNA_ID=CAMNT_0053664461 /DNA_START=20 /DNA_END=739 /DNA_ORIENTATION=+